MRTGIEIWAAECDRTILQPLLVNFCLLTAPTYEEGFKKFVKMRRGLGLYVNMAVICPHLVKHADDITLWDSKNISVGKIANADSLPRLVASNLNRLNCHNPGQLRAYFPDDSILIIPIPIDRIASRVDPSDPTSIEY